MSLFSCPDPLRVSKSPGASRNSQTPPTKLGIVAPKPNNHGTGKRKETRGTKPKPSSETFPLFPAKHHPSMKGHSSNTICSFQGSNTRRCSRKNPTPTPQGHNVRGEGPAPNQVGPSSEERGDAAFPRIWPMNVQNKPPRSRHWLWFKLISDFLKLMNVLENTQISNVQKNHLGK